MSEIKVEVLKHPTEEDWQWVKVLALNTVGQKYLMDKEMSLTLKKKYLKSEHSPIRYLHFVIRMEVPYYISVHFRTHKMGVEHFVQSQRNDRQDNYDRRKAPQDSPVSHIMYIDAPELMYIARKRLCGKADVDTQKVMRAIVREVLKTNPEFADVLVPNCQYLHECPEFQSCGRWSNPATKPEPAEEAKYEPTCLGRLLAFDTARIEPYVKEIANTGTIHILGPDDKSWARRCECMRSIFLEMARWLNEDSDVMVPEDFFESSSNVGAGLEFHAFCRKNKKGCRQKVELYVLQDMSTGGIQVRFRIMWPTRGVKPACIPEGSRMIYPGSLPEYDFPVTSASCVKIMRDLLESLPWNEKP